jgi:hypothetical protein
VEETERLNSLQLITFFLLYRHMQMLQQRSPGPRLSSDLSPHHLGFRDPSLGESLFYPSEKKSPAKRWPAAAPLEPTPPVEQIANPAPEEKQKLFKPPDVAFGWNRRPEPKPKEEFGWNRDIAKPSPRPPFLPNGVIKAELSISEFRRVLESLELFFKKESIQATFCDVPPSVKLQTLDLVELVIKFWEALPDHFSVDIQKCRGDNYKFHNIMHRLLEVINGIEKPEIEGKSPEEMDYAIIQEMHSFLEKLAPKPSVDSTNHTERMILLLHMNLKSSSFSLRASGLESFIQATDIRCTIVQHAREAALVVLIGKAPAEFSESLDLKCHEIQEVLIHVLLEREFHGDETWKDSVFGEETVPAEKVVAKSSHHPFKKTRSEFQGQYENVMMSSIHKVLTILSNSLEVLTCEKDETWNIPEMISSFLSRCRGAAGEKSLVSTLAKLMMDGCKQCMAVAYLACHVLRLLSSLYPPLQEELRAKSVRDSIDQALQTGRICHSLLEKESLLLRNGITG